MLGLQLPILFYYDAAITLVSALSAILLVGAALILLHFTERTPKIVSLAGGIVGLGVLVMHYIGLSGLELCRAAYTLPGVALSSIVAIGLCILAFRIAYGRRTRRNILLGTLCFAISVCSGHFLAIAGTAFVEAPTASEFGPNMSNETLALGVILFSFLIFGAFLWVGVAYLGPGEAALPMSTPVPGSTRSPRKVTETPAPSPPKPTVATHFPCERDGG